MCNNNKKKYILITFTKKSVFQLSPYIINVYYNYSFNPSDILYSFGTYNMVNFVALLWHAIQLDQKYNTLKVNCRSLLINGNVAIINNIIYTIRVCKKIRCLQFKYITDYGVRVSGFDIYIEVIIILKCT